MRTRILFLGIWAGLFPPALMSRTQAEDWPQFRGVEGRALAVSANPPVSWSNQQGVKWKKSLPGPGSSSPIVIKNNVLVTCYTGYGTSSSDSNDSSHLLRGLLCLNRETGAEEWKLNVPSTSSEDRYTGYLTEHGYASSTPVSDGENIYCFFGKSGVVACDLKGKKLWQSNVGTDSDPRRWGSAASPILYKDIVIVNASSESQSVRGLDKKTGKEIWKAPASRLALSFGTPALAKVSDQRTDLIVAAPGEVWGLNPDTGKLIWYAGVRSDGNISPSVLVGDGVVYITGGFTGKGTTCIRVGGKGDVTKTHIEWSIKQSSYVPTPLLHNNLLHWVNEEGIAVCADAKTGKILYEERLSLQGGGRGGKPFYASPVLAQNKIYAVSRKAGVFVLAGDSKFEQISANKPLDDTDFNATPAIAGNQLFLRSNKFLYCLESK
ncbi:PQQ-binding-like beta-propeller repeat protein [Telmatocola sphagniphila]|uniref:PQQ-binding-like beta-propeller repeat protein n=1 Tax=Telmatocola sphagniphila TaxID=1123043 RepID=A0A8E6EYF8_9BACT|nr:PQQ-binding-like beta-propeller repeat protein [Telmatocola sphagniphila]QVL32633.1 PQQ-binding-like beta-propeller repeat protein [Telmatocola sphagniphila]